MARPQARHSQAGRPSRPRRGASPARPLTAWPRTGRPEMPCSGPHIPQLADPGQPGCRRHAEHPFRGARPEQAPGQGHGHKPPLGLHVFAVHVDAETGKVMPARHRQSSQAWPDVHLIPEVPARPARSAVRAANTEYVLTAEPMPGLSQRLPAPRYSRSGTGNGTFGLARRRIWVKAGQPQPLTGSPGAPVGDAPIGGSDLYAEQPGLTPSGRPAGWVRAPAVGPRIRRRAWRPIGPRPQDLRPFVYLSRRLRVEMRPRGPRKCCGQAKGAAERSPGRRFR